MARILLGSGCLAALFLVYANATFFSSAQEPVINLKAEAGKSEQAEFLVRGTTQSTLKRKGILAPAVLHPVTAVFVSVGDKVKKGQSLIQLDDDEPQADVRVKKAILESAGVAKREGRRYLANLQKLQLQGAVPEQRIHDARAIALKAEADERAAKAAVEASLAELEHYVVPAPIDGVVNRLEVHPGVVSRPGTTDWGEVLDISVIDVRCRFQAGQVERVKVGDEAEVLSDNLATSHGTGRVVFIGLEANPQDGTIPALVHFHNGQAKLRCESPVQLRFGRGHGTSEPRAHN